MNRVRVTTTSARRVRTLRNGQGDACGSVTLRTRTLRCVVCGSVCLQAYVTEEILHDTTAWTHTRPIARGERPVFVGHLCVRDFCVNTVAPPPHTLCKSRTRLRALCHGHARMSTHFSNASSVVPARDDTTSPCRHYPPGAPHQVTRTERGGAACTSCAPTMEAS